MVIQEFYAGLKTISFLQERLPPFEEVKQTADSIRGKSLPESIEGCLLVDDVHWRFSAEREEESLVELDVDQYPYCPNCHTELERTTDDLIGSSMVSEVRNRPFWDCVECDDSWSRTKRIRSDVEKHARKNAEKIIETRGKPFSLDVLADKYKEQNDGESPSGKDIWRVYVSEQDGERLTTKCFYDAG